VGWMTVPAFGEWDVKNGAVPDYSMDFSKIREMRKQNKRELSRASLGGDEDLLQQQQKPQATQPSSKNDHRGQLHGDDDRSPPVNNNSLHSHSLLAELKPLTISIHCYWCREGTSSSAISNAASEPEEL
jgi:hypothetical protein